MAIKVFVDGQEGTTGLKIRERLAERQDIDILMIDQDKRRDKKARAELLNRADIVFLCLPDSAARESVALVENDRTRIIDASTAHRTNPQWVYGIPELSPLHRKAISESKRVSVPGCHASGLILALYPLVKEGIVPKDYPVTCHSITGYSGGGRKMIDEYQEGDQHKEYLQSPRFYGLCLNHKHLPEMQAVCGLDYPPLFTPIVGNFYSGMMVAVPLTVRMLNYRMSAHEVREFLISYYAGCRFVKVMDQQSDLPPNQGFLSAIQCNNTNKLEIFVTGDDDQVLVISRLDNLGKGSSGAAVQNMNIMLGLDEDTGL